jgi:hypothetical protein
MTMPPVVKKNAPPVTPSPVKEPLIRPPPLPARRPEPAKDKLPPLNPTGSPDSIFLPDNKDEADAEKPPVHWKHLEPGELSSATEGLQSLEVFSRSQRVIESPGPVKDSPPVSTQKPAGPPPLPPLKPAEKSAPPALGQAPPLLEKPSEPQVEKIKNPAASSGELTQTKLNAPPLPVEARKAEAPPPIGSAKPQPGPQVPALKEDERKPAAGRGKSIPFFLFPPAKPKPKPPTPAVPVSSPSIKVEESKPELKTPSPQTQVPGAASKPPPVDLSAKPAAPVGTAATPPIPGPAAKTAASTPFTLPVSKAAPDKPAVPAKPVKPSPANPAAKSTALSSAPLYAPRKLEEPSKIPPAAAAMPTRSARARKRNRMETIWFYLFFAGIWSLFIFGALHFGHETRIEGQVIPPPGTTLANEVWIVGDFRNQALGIAEDLAADRAPALRDIQEAQDHVNRAQADVAAREERIRLLREQAQAARDEIASIIKQAHDDAQQIWDKPGAQLEDEYNSRLNQLQKSIADRARALNLKYQPDDTYHSPEVWANAYRLALYDMPAGVDSTKEHQWLEDQMKQWRDFTKSVDDRQKQLREQAAQIQLATTPKVSDLNSHIDELKGRIDGTLAEEEPLKAELQQAQLDLANARAREAGLDGVRYKQLYALPESTMAINKHLPFAPNGRFSWRHVEKDSPFAEGEKKHYYYLLVRAIRPDGRQYWSYIHLVLPMNETLPIKIEPSDFISTKSILRPDLSPDEQLQ